MPRFFMVACVALLVAGCFHTVAQAPDAAAPLASKVTLPCPSEPQGFPLAGEACERTDADCEASGERIVRRLYECEGNLCAMRVTITCDKGGRCAVPSCQLGCWSYVQHALVECYRPN